VIYVSDMAQAESWQVPGAENWIDARSARYVINSDRIGGMGLPEAIPFGTEAAAVAWQADHGGHVVGWTDIPDGYQTAGGVAAGMDHKTHKEMSR